MQFIVRPWFGWVLYYRLLADEWINHYRLFNTKSSSYIYHKIYRIWLGLVLWHINHCRLFNAKSSLYIYVTLCRCSAKQTIPLSVLARNKTKGFGPAISTWPEVVRGRDKRVGQRDWEVGSWGRVTRVTSWHRSRETSRQEIGSSDSEEDRSG